MLDAPLSFWLDQTINGVVIGNIYALIAIGLALIFGVANLVNFAHGSVFMIGAYAGWVCITRLHWPLPAAMLTAATLSAIVGVLIERIGLRGLYDKARIAPLLATIGISFTLDQIVQLIFTATPQGFPAPLPEQRIPLGTVSIGLLDVLIAAITVGAALALFGFLRFTRLGWALRAAAQDREAAQQMGVDTDRANMLAFAVASALGGVAGVLVGMYFNSVYTSMSFQATIKGFVANLLGGLGSVSGAILGGILLGLIESYGVALFGASYRNLFSYAMLVLVLVFLPQGLFGARRALPPEPLTGTFVPSGGRVRLPRAMMALTIGAALVPLLSDNPYLLQTLSSAFLFALLALSVTLVTGMAGQTSLGQAGFMAIGGYASALLVMRVGVPFELALLLAALSAALVGSLLMTPVFRLRSQYMAIATLGVGEIVNQVILNWDAVTGGALGLSRIPPPTFLGAPIIAPRDVYWATLVLLVAGGLLAWRMAEAHLGRTWRAIRDDEVAARAFGVNLARYKWLAFLASGFIAGLSGAFTAHTYSYINHETFAVNTSILALTMVILGGMGNLAGAVLGALALTAAPELLRAVADYRYLLYGLVLVLLIRFRPQGLLGTL